MEPEVFARFLGVSDRKGSFFDDVLPVPKVKTEIGKNFLFDKGKMPFLPVIAATLL